MNCYEKYKLVFYRVRRTLELYSMRNKTVCFGCVFDYISVKTIIL